MAYSRKLRAFFGGLGHDHTVDCTWKRGAAILPKIGAADDDRQALATQAAALDCGLVKLGVY